MLINEATWDYILKHSDDDVRQLALQGTKEAGVDMLMALQQIAGRQTAQRKLPSWAAIDGIMYPPHLNMEQCSSEATARYKAKVAGCGNSFVDLTGGFGIDFYWIAQQFSHRTYIEQNAYLCNLAEHNFRLLGLNCSVQCSTTAKYLTEMPHASLIFLDPARRNEHGGRTYGIEDCSPNVVELLPILCRKADRVIIKLSPMLDWHNAVETLRLVKEVHIVSVSNECKELLLVLSNEENENLRLVCVNDESCFEVIPTMGTTDSHHGNDGFPQWEKGTNLGQYRFLYEPNASIMKAGCFAELTKRFDVSLLAPNSHLFLSPVEIRDFPGRGFIIQAISSMNKKELRTSLGSLERANISVRNFPLAAEELRKRLKLKNGGCDYIFATTLYDNQHRLFICRKIG